LFRAGGADRHHQRRRCDVTGAAHERAERPGGPGAVTQHEIDLDQAEGFQRLGIGRRLENREAAEPAQQPRAERVVQRHDQDGVHAATGQEFTRFAGPGGRPSMRTAIIRLTGAIRAVTSGGSEWLVGWAGMGDWWVWW